MEGGEGRGGVSIHSVEEAFKKAVSFFSQLEGGDQKRDQRRGEGVVPIKRMEV